MRYLLTGLLLITSVWTGEVDAADRTLVFSGLAPVGAYQRPANFSAGLATGSGKVAVGVEITRDELVSDATEVELVGEISYDAGVSWPPDCLPAPATRCHDSSQSMPANADWFAIKTKRSASTLPAFIEYTGRQATDANTRIRGRLIVRGADARGAVTITWR
jgi:hypothetical protein